ncbi:Cytochrome b5 [Lamellibrachia satsuma]|nr:Cytochrome b5 [Lamellibrachia satsuma]
MAKIITLAELKKHTGAKDLWIAIDNKVYDVSKFADVHPGGEQVILEQGGSFATEVFEDVGHSTDARELMKDFYIGELDEADHEKKSSKSPATPVPGSEGRSLTGWLVPLGIAFVAALIYRYLTSGTNLK